MMLRFAFASTDNYGCVEFLILFNPTAYVDDY